MTIASSISPRTMATGVALSCEPIALSSTKEELGESNMNCFDGEYSPNPALVLHLTYIVCMYYMIS